MVSNFIPTDSKKFEFQDFNWTMRFFIKNKLELKKNEVTWPSDFWEKSIYDFETLTHNIVNTVSNRQFLISSSDATCFKEYLMKVWWLGDYVKWRNYEKSIFWTWAILELLITQVSTYTHISNWNFNADSVANLKWIICKYTSFDAKFNADFEFEVKNLFLPTHLRENRALKNLRGLIRKIWCALNSH